MDSAEPVSFTGVVKVRGDVNRKNIFHKLDMMGHKGFLKDRVKTEKGTFRVGVTKKDTRTGFGI